MEKNVIKVILDIVDFTEITAKLTINIISVAIIQVKLESGTFTAIMQLCMLITTIMDITVLGPS
jgi:hypothetical protein